MTMFNVSNKVPTRVCFTLLVWAMAWWAASCGGSNTDESSRGKATDRNVSEKRTRRDTDSISDSSASVHSFLDWTVLPVDVPVFERLSSEEKRDLYTRFRRQHRNTGCTGEHVDYCRVRHILEQVLRHPGGISLDIRHKIKAYLLQLWVFGSNVHPITQQIVRPTFIPGELGAATQHAIQNGADIDVSAAANVPLEANNIEQLEALLTEVRPYIFGVRDGFDGSDTAAVPREEAQSDTDNSAAAADSDSSSNATPLMQSMPIYVVDPNFSTMLQKLYQLVDFLDKKVREVGGTKSTAARADVPLLRVAHLIDLPNGSSPLISDTEDLFGFGVTGMVSDEFGRIHPVLWLNVNEAFEHQVGERLTSAFSGTRSASERRTQRRQLVSVAYHALRQIAGFGKDGTENKSDTWLTERLGTHFDVISELRADLAALYLSYNEELPAIGVLPDDATRNALFDEYLHSPLEAIAGGFRPEQHPRIMARMIVLNYLIAENVVSVEVDGDNRLRLHVADYAKLKTPVVQLLGRVRNIRFFGDGGKAGTLIEQYAFVQAGWKKRLRDQFENMNISSRYLMLLPVLEVESNSSRDSKVPSSVQLRKPRTVYDRYISLSQR
ncbi:MAG: hypothetical protein JXX29_18620 [Deltaproteobacteria bacterium]|nr:hypothetical protein [Deltaproteobacteria bacterium]MBN2673700.1 hypothetical protein [Deltaproteobacteria bacterium]